MRIRADVVMSPPTFNGYGWRMSVSRSGAIPRDAGSIQRDTGALTPRFSELYSREPLYFLLSCEDTDEDRTTVLYLQDCAQQAARNAIYLY